MNILNGKHLKVVREIHAVYVYARVFVHVN